MALAPCLPPSTPPSLPHSFPSAQFFAPTADVAADSFAAPARDLKVRAPRSVPQPFSFAAPQQGEGGDLDGLALVGGFSAHGFSLKLLSL